MAKLKEITNGIGILDMEHNFTPESAYAFLESLGAQGRQLYIRLLIFLDFVFPLSYSLFYSFFVMFFLSKTFPAKNQLLGIGLIPVLAGLFDYLENILELTMLLYYPKRLTGIAYFTNIANSLKFLFIGISALLMVVSLGLYLVKYLRNKREITP